MKFKSKIRLEYNKQVGRLAIMDGKKVLESFSDSIEYQFPLSRIEDLQAQERFKALITKLKNERIDRQILTVR